MSLLNLNDITRIIYIVQCNYKNWFHYQNEIIIFHIICNSDPSLRSENVQAPYNYTHFSMEIVRKKIIIH